jgi:hypothetical protein
MKHIESLFKRILSSISKIYDFVLTHEENNKIKNNFLYKES